MVSMQCSAGRRICSVCTGTFVLAQAGLIDGKRVVTHWQAAEALRTQFRS
ncbi:MAG: DJ-1/PfpI family protein [Gammaproteobacteria bacterium]